MLYPSEETYLQAANAIMRRYRGARNAYGDQMDQLLSSAEALSNLISLAAASGEATGLPDISLVSQQVADQLAAARILSNAWVRDIQTNGLARDEARADIGEDVESAAFSMENVVPFDRGQ